MFFITYTIFQPPGTILCRKIGPRVFLSLLAFCWGCVTIGHGFAQHWTQLIALRLVLGLFEVRHVPRPGRYENIRLREQAAFFPGVVFLLSTWYKRYEMGKRYAFFYLIGVVATAFGGIMAYGLMQMDGLSGYRGWRWIFIIQGIVSTSSAPTSIPC